MSSLMFSVMGQLWVHVTYKTPAAHVYADCVIMIEHLFYITIYIPYLYKSSTSYSLSLSLSLSLLYIVQ